MPHKNARDNQSKAFWRELEMLYHCEVCGHDITPRWRPGAKRHDAPRECPDCGSDVISARLWDVTEACPHRTPLFLQTKNLTIIHHSWGEEPPVKFPRSHKYGKKQQNGRRRQ